MSAIDIVLVVIALVAVGVAVACALQLKGLRAELRERGDSGAETLAALEQANNALDALNVALAETRRMVLMHLTDTETMSALKNVRFVTEEVKERAKALAEERATGKPLQHVLGEAYFYGRTFISDKRALIPRQDSEFLATAVVAAIREYVAAGKAPAVLELCTGSGALAVTVSQEAGVHVDASDIDTQSSLHSVARHRRFGRRSQGL